MSIRRKCVGDASDDDGNGAAEKTPKLAAGLYVAATPIGNMGDVSARLVETLRDADLILCEDTRRTGQLCAALGVTTPRRSYHDHNGAEVRPAVLNRLREGAAIALVSDAGTPLISDPGYKLVAEARAAGHDVFAVPGPCAAIAALSVAGLPTDRFFFAGFPPAKARAREALFEDLKRLPASLVFYEAANRLADTLGAMTSAFGDRQIAIVRELTKKFEETRTGPLFELAKAVASQPVKGEVVIVVGPPSEDTPADDDAVDAFLADALQEMSVKDAAAAAAESFGVSKKEAYQLALAQKRKSR
ncbi:MAG: 16S rRNA (cytidine(1402)-2'-O)-methyltransferase [Pseudomonadota bacterium]